MSQTRIVPFPALSHEGVHQIQGQSFTFKYVAYLIDGYRESPATDMLLDSFVQKSRRSDTACCYTYSITFYKKTNKTNLESAEIYKKGVPPESIKDMVADYKWNNGKPSGVRRYRDGELLGSGEVELTPIKQ